MKKFAPVLIFAFALAFTVEAQAGDRYGYRGWHGGHYGHGHGHGYGHGYRSGFNIVLSAPLYLPSYNYSPYRWYARPPVIVQQAPVTYVQRESAEAASSDYWYFCPDTRTYYPYTQSCPSEWLQVVPQTVPR